MKITQGADFSIHKRHQKSFDADIKTTKARFHVKSVHHDRSEKSWTFQKTDRAVYQPEDDEILVFCITYPTYVEIVGACKAVEASDFYTPPGKSELCESKECLYFTNDPEKFNVPEVGHILQSLDSVLKVVSSTSISKLNSSRRTCNRYAWKEF